VGVGAGVAVGVAVGLGVALGVAVAVGDAVGDGVGVVLGVKVPLHVPVCCTPPMVTVHATLVIETGAAEGAGVAVGVADAPEAEA
jgi:hypothetical protein